MTEATRARAAAPVLGSLRWVVRHRAWTPYHLVRYWRFALFRLRHPSVRTEGLVFLGRRVEVSVRRGYGRVVLGRWVHLGEDTRLRCHEGTLRIGDKCVFGRDSTVNCYLDVEIGPATMVSDSVYICDFDHVTARLDLPIKDQGIVKAPVRIGGGSWVGTKVTVLRGTEVGRGSVVAAGSVVRGTFPDYAVLAGVPARLVKTRTGRPGDGPGVSTSSTAGTAGPQGAPDATAPTAGTAEPQGVSDGHIVGGTPPAG